MKDKEEFYSTVSAIDGQPFAEYARLIGDFDFSRYVLKISRIQEEGGSTGTLFVVRVPQIIAGFPPHLFNTPVRRTALEDLLNRQFAAGIDALAKYDAQGMARRRLFIACPGQKILPRSSIVMTEEYVEARVYVNLPARQGCVAGALVQEIFFEDLPTVINASLIYCNLPEVEVDHFVDLMEDADQLRQLLPTRGWVSFVAEGSMLPRQLQGDLPDYTRSTPLTAASDLCVSLEVPNAAAVKGFGVPSGLTVILGDAHSGRLELMRALAAGIYNHVPGDGRELAITVPDAIYLRAEPGRSVQRVNLGAFLRTAGAEAAQYSCTHADAFCSQAAATVEALEVGARVLLFDESDSASEFLAHDPRLTGLLPPADQRLIPLSARARQLVDELGVSIVVAGSAAVAAFLPIADTVLRVQDFQVTNVTAEAKALALPAESLPAEGALITSLVEKSRWVVPSSIDPSAGRFDAVIEAPSMHRLIFGRSTIDLAGIDQLADIYQTRTIGQILYYAKLRYMDEPRPLRELLDLVDRDLSTEGLETLSRDLRGDLARPRRYEIAEALNRLATLRVARGAE